jgi:hypothetical protein
MTSLRVMGIIGLCIGALSWICMAAWTNVIDYEYAIGWGLISIFYMIALCIVCIVKGKKTNK